MTAQNLKDVIKETFDSLLREVKDESYRITALIYVNRYHKLTEEMLKGRIAELEEKEEIYVKDEEESYHNWTCIEYKIKEIKSILGEDTT